MGSLSVHALNLYVSKHLGAISSPTIKSIASEFPEHQYWVGNFVLNQVFSGLETEHRELFFVVLRRAEAAFDDWELACKALASVQPSKRMGYFKALRHLENAISALEQAFQFGRTVLKLRMFTKGDGSAYQRLNFVYNESRHHDPSKLPTGELHGAWITDDGFHVPGGSISFDELRVLMEELGRVADAMSSGRAPA